MNFKQVKAVRVESKKSQITMGVIWGIIWLHGASSVGFLSFHKIYTKNTYIYSKQDVHGGGHDLRRLFLTFKYLASESRFSLQSVQEVLALHQGLQVIRYA